MTTGDSKWWVGACIYPATFGADFKQSVPCAWADPLFPRYIDAQIARAKAAGLNIIRCTDWLDRLPTVPGKGLGVMVPQGATTSVFVPGVIPDQLWLNLDYLFDHAAEVGIDVCLDLSAFRNTIDGHQDALSLNGYDPSLWTAFLKLCVPRYAARHNLAYWSIGGEPKPPHNGGVSATALTAFYAGVSSQIRALAPRDLISCGGLSYLNWASGIDWKAIFSLPDIDLVAMHRYSQGDEDVTMPMVAAWAKDNNKPWLLEEFGFKQSDGDATRATEFTRVAKLAISLNARAVMYWNSGPEIKDGTFDISEKTPLVWAAVQAVAKTAR